VRVNRNHFGRQVESFQADLDLPFLSSQDDISQQPFPGVFIRAPVVEKILPNVEGAQADEEQVAATIVAPSRKARDEHAKAAMSSKVEVMGVLPGRVKKAASNGVEVDAAKEVGDIIAVKQGNVFGTSFHPELSSDIRIHVWWLKQVLSAV
jgi:pyridoxal 5'-phosphate synthase pdxT subunit